MNSFNSSVLKIVILLFLPFVTAIYSQTSFSSQAPKLSLTSNMHSNLTLKVNYDEQDAEDVNSDEGILLSPDLVPTDGIYFDGADTTDDSDTSEAYQRERRLLPEDISWTENLFWGVHGVFTSEPLTSSERKNELSIRRTMLTWHQRLGITTWVLMSATVLAGQLTLNGNRQFRSWHGPLAVSTIAGYGATALLAILSPPPLIRRNGEHDTVFFHKLLAYIHAAGMIALPFLANAIARRSVENGKRGPEQIDAARARAHQIAAYVTYAAFTASILTIVF